MFELLLSDPVILLFAATGLVATGVSMVRDARTQRAQLDAEQFVVAEELAEAA